MGYAKNPTSRYAAEFLGTFMIVFTVGLTKTVGKDDASLAVFAPTSIACVLMVMVYSLGGVSGGHFNPAVTFSVWLQKDPEFTGEKQKNALVYVVVQLVAGVLAGMSTGFLYGGGELPSLGPNFNENCYGGSRNATDFGKACYDGAWLGAPLVEFFYTFMLCFVVLNTACSNAESVKGNSYYGIAIGFVIIAGGYGGGFVSGAVFNPAVALGVAVLKPQAKTFYLPIYILCELAGGFVAVSFFHIARPEDKKESEGDAWYMAPAKLAHKLEGYLDPEDTSEVLGTFMVTLTVSLNALAATRICGAGPTVEPLDESLCLPNGNPGGVWSIAASLMCMIYAVGDVSGGLFNPALTVACLVRWFGTGLGFPPKTQNGYEKLCDPNVSKKEGPKYLLAQIIGASLGAVSTGLVTFAWPPAAQIQPGLISEAKGSYTLSQAFFAEFFGTFLLAYVVLCVATTKQPLKQYTAFAIGGCIIAGGYGLAPISGGVLNPAITIARGLLFEFSLFTDPAPIVYVLAELLGGVVAAVIFKFVTHQDEYEQQTEGEDQTEGYQKVDDA